MTQAPARTTDSAPTTLPSHTIAPGSTTLPPPIWQPWIIAPGPITASRFEVIYDSLILAAGAQQSYFGHPEFTHDAPGMKSLDDALEVRGRIFGAFEMASLEPDPEVRRRWLTFVVVGAGPTGVEMAGRIAELSRRPAPQLPQDRPRVGAGRAAGCPAAGTRACLKSGGWGVGYEMVSVWDRAGAVRRDLAAGARTLLAMARICRALDGMPLAIELAAARLRTISIDQLARRLDDRFRLLTSGSRTALPRHKTLRAVVDWSWELLTGAERMVLRRLSVFWGGASLEAAEQVCAGDAAGREQVLE